jgi:hypothetical protein
MICSHPKMQDTARRDWCPDCGYEFYYGDAHAVNPEDRVSKLVNPGRDKNASKTSQQLADEYWREVEEQRIRDREEY